MFPRSKTAACETNIIYIIIIVHYHGNHFLNPIFLDSESGCHGNVLHYITVNCPVISIFCQGEAETK